MIYLNAQLSTFGGKRRYTYTFFPIESLGNWRPPGIKQTTDRWLQSSSQQTTKALMTWDVSDSLYFGGWEKNPTWKTSIGIRTIFLGNCGWF